MKRADEIPAETLMAYLDGELPAGERREFERLLEQHPEWREEVAEMAMVVDTSKKLHLRVDSSVWDNYWEEIDDQLSRQVGWLLAAFGGAILLFWGFVKVLLMAENNWARLGVVLVVAGVAVLFGAVLRGRLIELQKDRYGRIKR